MKRIVYCLATCLLAAGCSSSTGTSESTNSSQEALDVTQTGSLTKMQGTVASLTNESDRQADTTNNYYTSVKIGVDGVSGLTIKAGLPTLQSFIDTYGFVGSEHIARYYNRGDLGIGREMHCVDRLD